MTKSKRRLSFDQRHGPKILVVLISVILGLRWFRPGLMIGSAESSLPFYDLSRLAGLSVWMWCPTVLGNVTAGMVTGSAPFFGTLSLFNSIITDTSILQTLFFWGILSASGLGCYFLLELISGGKNRDRSFLGAAFYLLNPFALTLVWNRLQYPYMFFYAFLPWGLFFFIKGLTERKIIYVFYLNLACLVSVMALATLPFLELFWLVIGFYLLFYLLINRGEKEKVVFGFKFFFLTLFLWLVLNLWWFLQLGYTLLATEFVTGQVVASDVNTSTLIAISERLGKLLYLFRFQHKTFFEEMRGIWGPIYFSPVFLILSFLAPIFTFASLLVKKKPPTYWYFAFLSVLGLFLAKGSAPPLGQIFLFAFSHFRPLEVFRNPAEKIGLILPLAFAPMFALGLSSFYSWLKRANKKFAFFSFFSLLCLLFVVYVFPVWNRWVFTSPFPPTDEVNVGYYVKVPPFYLEANQWLEKDKSEFRGIALPIDGVGITYDWEYGYAGVELSDTLFSKPFVSLNPPLPYLNEIVSPLENFFLENPDWFYKLMGVLNSKYLMTRSDIDYQLRGMRSPEVIRRKLKEVGEERGNGERLELVRKFGELEFYRVPEELFLPHFYVADSISFVDQDLQSPYLPLSFDEFRLKETVVSSQGKNNLPLETAEKIYLSARPHPQRGIEIVPEGEVKSLPGSKLYPVVCWQEARLQEKIVASGDRERIFDFHLRMADKRLREIEKLIEKEKKIKAGLSSKGKQKTEADLLATEKLISDTWKRFEENLDKALDFLAEIENQGSGEIPTIIYRALDYLRSFQGKFASLLPDYDFRANIPEGLEKLLIIRQKLEEKAWLSNSQLEKRYLIRAPKKGDYELFIRKDKSQGNAPSKEEPKNSAAEWEEMFEQDPFRPLKLALDGRLATVSGEEREDCWLSFGKHDLDEGQHRLQLFLPNFVNLAETKNLTLSAKEKKSLVLSLDKFLAGGRNFNLFFDYQITGENLPRLVVVQKLQIDGENKTWRLVNTLLPKSDYRLQFIKSFALDPRAYQAELVIFFEDSREAILTMENFQLTRDWHPEVVWRFSGETDEMAKTPQISFQRINPTKYEVLVERGEDPYLLVFSEAFHPGWKVYLEEVGNRQPRTEFSYFDDKIKEGVPRNSFFYPGISATWGKNPILGEKHLLVNGYANGWYVEPEDVGGQESYKLVIEFWPQRLFYWGLGISLLALAGSLIVAGRSVSVAKKGESS